MIRIVIVGGPRSGKSTLASKLGVPHFCTDPKSLVKDVQPNTTYLPEGLDWGKDSEFVCSNWFTKNESWVIEGVGAVRALRKWVHKNMGQPPCDKIVVLREKYPGVTRNDGQEAMNKAVMTVWNEVADKFKDLIIYQ